MYWDKKGEDAISWYPFKKNTDIFIEGQENNFITILKEKKLNVGKDLDKYDYVIFYGIYENACGRYSSVETFADFIGSMFEKLNADGHLLLLMDNRMGLKYWAGCRDRMHGFFFEGIEGYPTTSDTVNFTKHELEMAISSHVDLDYKFYYLYPDIETTDCVYTDDYLPKPGELTSDRGNFFEDRMKLFNETLVYDTLIKEGLFPQFANSFFVDICRK